MKTTILAAAVLLTLSATAHANCTNGANNWPKCDNQAPVPQPPPKNPPAAVVTPAPAPVTQTASPTASADPNATAGAAAGAQAGAAAGAEATGGAATATGTGGRSSSNSGVTNSTGGSSYKALAIGLPQPVHTVIPAAQACIVSKSTAHALGWNFWSTSDTDQRVLPECAIPLQIIDLRAACQFHAANQLQARFITVQSGVEIATAGDMNLTAAQCWELRNPPPKEVVVEKIVDRIVYVDKGCPAPDAPAKPKGPKRKPITCPKPDRK